MKRIALILLMAFVAIYPIVAQEDLPTEDVTTTEEVILTSVPTAEPTLEPTDATVEPAPVTVVAPTVVPTQTPGNGNGNGGGSGSGEPAWLGPVILGLLIIVFGFGAIDRYHNGKISREAMSQIPPQYLPLVQHGIETAQRELYNRGIKYTNATPGQWDNNFMDDEMKRAGWERYTDPITGDEMARKKVAVVAPIDPALPSTAG